MPPFSCLYRSTKDLLRDMLSARATPVEGDIEEPSGIELLPREILTEILLRVPVESLLEAKAVSRGWRGLIGDPDFARLHLERSRSRKEVICRTVPSCKASVFSNYIFGSYRCSSLSFEFDHGVVKVHSRSLGLEGCLRSLANEYQIWKNDMDLDVLDSCNGLLLLEIKGQFDLYKRTPLLVANPITRSYRLLDVPTSVAMEDCHWKIIYDSSVGKYKIIGLVSGGCSETECYLYELPKSKAQPGSWKKVQTPDLSNNLKEVGVSLYADGKLHFLVNQYDKKARFTTKLSVLSVNVSTEEVVWTSSNLPPISIWDFQFASSGRLFQAYHRADKTELWVLEDFNSMLWSRHRDIVGDAGHQFGQGSSLSMHPVASLDDKLVLSYTDQLLVYDGKWERVETDFKEFAPMKYSMIGNYDHYAIYVNSLITWN